MPAASAHIVVLAEYVTTEDGTGLVHQSPLRRRRPRGLPSYGLPVVNPIDGTGHFLADVPLAAGTSSRPPTRRWSRT